nr:MAG TPA: hypothetical protein [Caudoviricetes sp.]
MCERVNLLTATRKAVNKKLSRRQWHIISTVGGVLLPCGWSRFGLCLTLPR